MVKVNELRVGNIVDYFSDNADHWYNGKALSENDLLCLLLDKGDHADPVSLTEEWLIKFSFSRKAPYTKFGNGQDWQPEYPRTDYKDYVINEFIVRYESFTYLSKEDKPGELITMDEDVNIHQGEWYEHFHESVRCPKIQYVHQLQNLYFALTGEELTIKE